MLYTAAAESKSYYTVIKQTKSRLILADEPQSNASLRLQMVKALEEISRIPDSVKAQSLLFIPKSVTAYWNLHTLCRNVPFIAPCITGIAIINGLPEKGCEHRYYGYESYPNADYLNWGNREPNLDELRHAVIEKGFSKLVVVRQGPENIIEVEFMDFCEHK
jgi:hypothetical protein